MGAWGYRVLEDDTASDWIGMFKESPSAERVAEAIRKAEAADFIDDWTGPHALAACEVLAAMNGKPVERIPEEIKAWAADQTAPEDLRASAVALIEKIYEESELREIWDDAGEEAVQKWKAALDDLVARLG